MHSFHGILKFLNKMHNPIAAIDYLSHNIVVVLLSLSKLVRISGVKVAE